jgi:protein-disulfide isomerase
VKRVAVAALCCLCACGGNGLTPVPVDGAPSLGPADAWVTVVEFGDFQCPYCAMAAFTVHEIASNWPDDVRVVFRHFPLTGIHEHAMSAAIAAECADEQGQFWKMYDALYADQSKLDDAGLLATATSLGLDVPTWQACIASDEARARVQSDLDLAGKLGVSGTPGFYVNGVSVEGAQPYDVFSSLIETELAKAQASGIPRASYYDKAVLGQ